MSRSVRRLALLTPVVLAALAIAGCSTPAVLDFPLFETDPDGAVTEPGTELGLDDIAYLENMVNFGDGPEPFLTAVSLRALETRTEDDWPDLVENPEEFAGYTPVVLIVEQQVVDETPESYNPQRVDVFPIYEDGEVAPYVVVDVAFGHVDQNATCGFDLHEHGPLDPVFQYCLIGAAETGDIVGIRFDGQRVGSPVVDETTPYWSDPVSWRA